MYLIIISKSYLEAGADIIETNTFNGTKIAQADYNLSDKVHSFSFLLFQAYMLNKTAAALAKKCTTEFTLENPSKPRFVAGAIGTYSKNFLTDIRTN